MFSFSQCADEQPEKRTEKDVLNNVNNNRKADGRHGNRDDVDAQKGRFLDRDVWQIRRG